MPNGFALVGQISMKASPKQEDYFVAGLALTDDHGPSQPWVAYYKPSEFKTYFGNIEIPSSNGVQSAPNFADASELSYSLFENGSGGVGGEFGQSFANN